MEWYFSQRIIFRIAFTKSVICWNKTTDNNERLLYKFGFEEKIDDNRIGTEITIDQIRNLNSFFHESSIDGMSKFIIIDSTDDLNINASNALLKILEEPKNDTYIFLISHNHWDITEILP